MKKSTILGFITCHLKSRHQLAPSTLSQRDSRKWFIGAICDDLALVELFWTRGLAYSVKYVRTCLQMSKNPQNYFRATIVYAIYHVSKPLHLRSSIILLNVLDRT